MQSVLSTYSSLRQYINIRQYSFLSVGKFTSLLMVKGWSQSSVTWVDLHPSRKELGDFRVNRPLKEKIFITANCSQKCPHKHCCVLRQISMKFALPVSNSQSAVGWVDQAVPGQSGEEMLPVWRLQRKPLTSPPRSSRWFSTWKPFDRGVYSEASSFQPFTFRFERFWRSDLGLTRHWRLRPDPWRRSY